MPIFTLSACHCCDVGAFCGAGLASISGSMLAWWINASGLEKKILPVLDLHVFLILILVSV